MTKCYNCPNAATTCPVCVASKLQAEQAECAARIEALEATLKNLAGRLEYIASTDGLRARAETMAMVRHYAFQARAELQGTTTVPDYSIYIERLERELYDAKSRTEMLAGALQAGGLRQVSLARAATIRIKALEAVLRPFAEAAERVKDFGNGRALTIEARSIGLNVRDLRAASDALREPGAENDIHARIEALEAMLKELRRIKAALREPGAGESTGKEGGE